MYGLLKFFLFLLPAETAHHLTMRIFKVIRSLPLLGPLLQRHYTVRNPRLHRQVFGIDFPNPVGLAAGFDKDGRYFSAMSTLGFGFIELGTVTPRPQAGNPRPRLFRLPKDRALINRMGFNNDGVEALVQRLQSSERKKWIIGGNIGKNKSTPNEVADADYRYCFEQLFPYVDYFVVNVSSPNTPGLRELQDKEPLTRLLAGLQEINRQKEKPKPLLLKIAPDLTRPQIDDILDIAKTTSLDGLIATNTTVSRSQLSTAKEKVEKTGAGGLSGQPLKKASTEILRYISKKTGGTLPIIAAGGIETPEDVREKLEAGASLVQVYTGLIYQGPGMVKKINKALLRQAVKEPQRTPRTI